MIESDPFEDFKRKRQIKKLEQKLTSDPGSPDAPVDVSESQDGSGVANQVDSEMMDFFGDGQAEDAAAPDGASAGDEAEPTPDGFQVTREQAEQVLSALGDGPEDAPASAFVEQLRNIFQQGVEEIAAAQRELDPDGSAEQPAPAGDAADDAPKGAIIPVEPSEPAVDVTKQGLEPERASGGDGEPKILKRQGHIPATNRRSAFSQLERAELRALKALLLAKGVITEDELRAEIARDLTP